MSGKTIVVILACVVIIMVVIFLSGYKGADKEVQSGTGYESNTGQAERSFDNARGMDTRLNQNVVHEVDVVKKKVTGLVRPGFKPENMPVFEVKQKTGSNGQDVE